MYQYSPIHLRIHPTSVSGYIINKQQWVNSIGNHMWPCCNNAILVSFAQRVWFQTIKGFFLDVFRQSLIWAFLLLNVTSGLLLVVNSLSVNSWRCLLIIDNDTPTFTGVFLTYLEVVKRFFFTKERILLSSTSVVFCDLPGLLMLSSSSVYSVFIEMYQIVGLTPPKLFFSA